MPDEPLNMTSNRPYLIRAFYEWIVDNDYTPHILVNATFPGTEVPLQSVTNGQIVLNISPGAVSSLIMNNDSVSFSARFSGVPQNLYVPIDAVMAIYGRENGQGMGFSDFVDYSESDITEPLDAADDNGGAAEETAELNSVASDEESTKGSDKNPPFLKVVK